MTVVLILFCLCPQMCLFMYSGLLFCKAAHDSRKRICLPYISSQSWWDRLKWHFHFSLMIPWALWLLSDPLNSPAPISSIPPALITAPVAFWWVLLLGALCSSRCRFCVSWRWLLLTCLFSPVCHSGLLSWCNQNTSTHFQNAGNCWKSRLTQTKASRTQTWRDRVNRGKVALIQNLRQPELLV